MSEFFRYFQNNNENADLVNTMYICSDIEWQRFFFLHKKYTSINSIYLLLYRFGLKFYFYFILYVDIDFLITSYNFLNCEFT